MEVHEFRSLIDRTFTRDPSLRLHPKKPHERTTSEVSAVPSDAEELISDRPTTLQSLAKPGRRLRFRRAALRNWSLELSACAIAITGFAGLLAVLAAYNGKEVVTSSDIFTPNAAVAAFSTVIRGALLLQIASVLSQAKWKYLANGSSGRSITALNDFDNASRGAWGSIRFLFSPSKGALHSWIGTACAIITILALAFDTFPQLVFTTIGSTKNVTISGLPRTEYYDNIETGALEVEKNFDLRFRAAAYNGFVTGLASDIEPVCPTGNCTWPLTPTLGICGSCMDVTSKIKTGNCTNTSDDSSEIPGTKICNYTLPDGHMLPMDLAHSIANLNGTQSSYHFESAQAFDVAYYDPLPTFNYTGTFPFMGFSAAGFSNHAKSTFTNSTYRLSATECQMNFCVKALNTTVNSGITQTNVVQTWNYTSNLASFTDVPSQYTPRVTNANGVLGFSIGTSFLVALGQTGGINVFGPCNFSEAGYYTCDSDYVHGILNVDDYDEYILNVSTALTAVMRLTATAPLNDTRYMGTAIQQLVFWHVRWPWITFPALILLVSTAVCLIAVLERDVPTPVPWKGDPLALLFCNVDKGLRESFVASAGNVDELRKRLRNTQGRLCLSEDGWTILPAGVD